MRGRRWGIVSAIVLVALAAPPAHAAPGDPDPTFAGDGTIITEDLPGGPIDLAVQPDGKVVVVGTSGGFEHARIVVRRYTVDGLPDLSFDGDGTIYLEGQGGSTLVGRSVTVDEAGRIVVVGAVYLGTVVVARLTPSGAPDTSFNGNGQARVTGLGLGVGSDVSVDDRGRIVVAGLQVLMSEDAELGFGSRMFVARLTGGGAMDRSFSDDGRLFLNPTPHQDELSALALDRAGRIVVAGSLGGRAAPSTSRSVVVRVRPDGRLDPAFGDAGVARLDLGPGDEDLDGVAVEPSGRVVATGHVGDARVRRRAVVVRLGSRGRFDPTFSQDGRLIQDFGPGGEVGTAVALDVRGRLVVGGTMRLDRNDRLLVARYRTDGTLDPAFSGNGWTAVDLDPSYEQTEALALDPTGAIVVAANLVNDETGLVRLLGS